MSLAEGSVSLLEETESRHKRVIAELHNDFPKSKLLAKQQYGTFVVIIIYVVSGVTQPLLSSQIKYLGLANAMAQLYMVPYFGGMACVGFFYLCIPSRRWCQYELYKPCGIAFLDVISQVLNFTGNNIAGSGIFSVIYASVSIWCAILSWLLGLRKLSCLQWLTVIMVFLGLAVSALDSISLGREIAVGAAMVFLGSFLHAVMYVFSEFVSSRGVEIEKIPPHITCAAMGSTETLILILWQCVYTIPHWNEAVVAPMEEQGTSWQEGTFFLLVVGFGNFVHAATFFFLLKWVGAVSAAVMKGLQAVLVFVVADYIFCPRHVEQCFDSYKGISLVIVVCGVLAYAVVTSKASWVTV